MMGGVSLNTPCLLGPVRFVNLVTDQISFGICSRSLDYWWSNHGRHPVRDPIGVPKPSPPTISLLNPV